MKYKADSPQQCTYTGYRRRRRRAAWWLVKTTWRHRYIATALGFIGWCAVKDPHGTWTAATNIATKLSAVVTALAS